MPALVLSGIVLLASFSRLISADFLNVPFFAVSNATDDCMTVPDNVTTAMPMETACKASSQPADEINKLPSEVQRSSGNSILVSLQSVLLRQLGLPKFMEMIRSGFKPSGSTECICLAPSESDLAMLSSAGFASRPNSKGFVLICGVCQDQGKWLPVLNK